MVFIRGNVSIFRTSLPSLQLDIWVIATSRHHYVHRHSTVSTCKLYTKTAVIKSKYWLVFVFQLDTMYPTSGRCCRQQRPDRSLKVTYNGRSIIKLLHLIGYHSVRGWQLDNTRLLLPYIPNGIMQIDMRCGCIVSTICSKTVVMNVENWLVFAFTQCSSFNISVNRDMCQPKNVTNYDVTKNQTK